jgi:succinyl-CoA synthetase alpha subunit
VVAYVAGLHAPTERRMGHAGTVNVFGQGDAEAKIEALREAGVRIAASAAEIGLTVRQAARA